MKRALLLIISLGIAVTLSAHGLEGVHVSTVVRSNDQGQVETYVTGVMVCDESGSCEDDPDTYDPDNPVCPHCLGYGCDVCLDTGSPILAEKIKSGEIK
jgi:hypothetical protein